MKAVIDIAWKPSATFSMSCTFTFQEVVGKAYHIFNSIPTWEGSTWCRVDLSWQVFDFYLLTFHFIPRVLLYWLVMVTLQLGREFSRGSSQYGVEGSSCDFCPIWLSSLCFSTLLSYDIFQVFVFVYSSSFSPIRSFESTETYSITLVPQSTSCEHKMCFIQK